MEGYRSTANISFGASRSPRAMSILLYPVEYCMNLTISLDEKQKFFIEIESDGLIGTSQASVRS
jgi:hypothetical protein